MNVNKLVHWSKSNFSHLPWRRKRSVYSTWISEVMLQQTTVHTVKNRLEKFIHQFPDVESLANSSDEKLLEAWKGLGYYQRAKNLKKAAIYLGQNFDGKFPDNLPELQSVPGVGPYTSSAIVSIGMNKKALAVDANLERVIARYYGLRTVKGPPLKKEIDQLFCEEKILKNKVESWRDLNQSMMDLGREICQARRADCLRCPIHKGCQAKKSDNALDFPVVSLKSKKEKYELDLIRLISIEKGMIASIKKNDGEWLSGQYELPTFVLRSTDKSLKQYPVCSFSNRVDLPLIKTGITKYKIKNFYREIAIQDLEKVTDNKKIVFLDKDSARKKLSTASLKILDAYFEEKLI